MTAITTGSISRASGVSGGTLDRNVCRRVGYTVYASARLFSITAKTANGTFMTVPDGFRPAATINVMGSANIVGTGNVILPVQIGTDGSVSIAYSSSVTADMVTFAGCWPVL